MLPYFGILSRFSITVAVFVGWLAIFLQVQPASAKGMAKGMEKGTKHPTAILEAPSHVKFGRSIVLDGQRSFDAAPGGIVKYFWNSVDCATNRLIPGRPLETREATLEVMASAAPSVCKFQLIVMDNAGNFSPPVSAEVIVKDADIPTAVLEAPSQVKFGRSFVLDGQRSSDIAPGKIVKYLWTSLDCSANRLITGAPLETSAPSLELMVNTAPSLCRFQLTVVDNSGNRSLADHVSVFVTDTQIPTAVMEAPPQVEMGRSFLLNGRRSSDVAPGKIITYSWTSLNCGTDKLIPGTPYETGEPTVGVIIPSAGRCTFELTVVDDTGNRSLPDRGDVIVRDPKNPTAILKAPPQVELGRGFLLDGRRSSAIAPGKIVAYVWTSLDCNTNKLIPGTPLETSEPTIEIMGNTPGRCTFELVSVNDIGNRSLPDRGDVIVRDTQNPTAVLEAPPQVEMGRSFLLDGRRSSDATPGKIVQYFWTSLECGTNRLIPGTPIETATPTIEITAISAGRCTFELTVVNDAGNRSLPDRGDIIVRDPHDPTAVLETPFQVELGRSFLLDGRRSSDVAPGTIVKYLWASLDCATDRLIPGTPLETKTPVIEVAADTAGRCTFELTAVDNAGNRSLPDRGTVMVRHAEHPTSVLEAPPQVELGRRFLLDGQRSSAIAPGTIVKYLWASLDCATDRLIPGTPIETNTPIIEVAADTAGRCAFELTVADENGILSMPDRVNVIIRESQHVRQVPDSPQSAPLSPSTGTGRSK